MANVCVNITWKPFFLNLNTPKEGVDLRQYLESKYGAAAVSRFNAPNNPLDVAGRGVGITFNQNRRVINTLDCHRLMEWCNENHPELSNQLMENLFHAYFEEAQDLCNIEILTSVAVKSELDESQVISLLQSDKYKNEVISFDNSIKTKRVSGVPYFIIETRSGRPIQFSGAQVHIIHTYLPVNLSIDFLYIASRSDCRAITYCSGGII
jgi:predicted DsbA family dithiol-disulfide isomerase